MIRFIIKLLFTYLVLFPFFGSAQGIRFNSSESPIVERTSYNVFAHDQQKFIGDFSIEFDLSIIDSKIFENSDTALSKEILRGFEDHSKFELKSSPRYFFLTKF